MKTVFLDRDGTINRESGYINHFSMFEFLPGAVKALQLLKDNGWQLILITNQSGVARAYFSEDDLNNVHQKMQALLKKENAALNGIYYCPHHPEAGVYPYKKRCDCRKPKTGLIDMAIRDYKVDLAHSFMVGDRYKDIQMGKKAGLKTAMVLSGYGRGEWESEKDRWPEQPDYIFNDLYDFAKFITD